MPCACRDLQFSQAPGQAMRHSTYRGCRGNLPACSADWPHCNNPRPQITFLHTDIGNPSPGHSCPTSCQARWTFHMRKNILHYQIMLQRVDSQFFSVVRRCRSRILSLWKWLRQSRAPCGQAVQPPAYTYTLSSAFLNQKTIRANRTLPLRLRIHHFLPLALPSCNRTI